MPSNFVVIHGDNPLEITPTSPYQFSFRFDETPHPDKPAVLYLNVQGLVETSEVSLNGSSVGRLYPVLDFSVNSIFTSPTYGGQNKKWRLWTGNGGNPQTWVEVNEFLQDLTLQAVSTAGSYWITQTINFSMGFQLNQGAFSPEGDEADFITGTNRLRLEAVSQPFRVKDIVLHYAIQ